MAKPLISPLIHRCVIDKGPMAGNKVVHEVQPHELTDYCGHCGNHLADPQTLLEHIYTELAFTRRR